MKGLALVGLYSLHPLLLTLCDEDASVAIAAQEVLVGFGADHILKFVEGRNADEQSMLCLAMRSVLERKKAGPAERILQQTLAAIMRSP